MNDFPPAPPLRGVTRYLMMLALAFPGSVTAQSEQPKSVKWEGSETFENAYTYSGRTSAHLGKVNEYNHQIIVYFIYIEETDAKGARKFTSRKINWTAQGKAVATGFTSTVCKGRRSTFEMVGLSDEALNKKLEIPCTTDDKGILAGSFTKPPSRIKPPKTVDWEKLGVDYIYREEKTSPNGERYTYSVRVWPACGRWSGYTDSAGKTYLPGISPIPADGVAYTRALTKYDYGTPATYGPHPIDPDTGKVKLPKVDSTFGPGHSACGSAARG